MPGLCGWIGDPPPLDAAPQVLAAIMSDLPGYASGADREFLLPHQDAAGGQTQGEGNQFKSPDGQIFLIIGRSRWMESGLRDLSVDGGDARVLAHAYDEMGVDFLGHLHGAFALAIIDPTRRTALLAIDRFGFETLRYALLDQATLVFASHSDALSNHPGLRPEISSQSIFDYLYFSTVPGERTIYRNIKKLLPGHYLLFENGRISTRPYYGLRYDRQNTGSLSGLTEELFARLRTSMRQTLQDRDAEQIGAFLSGGLDSSTVLGLANEALGQPIKSFTSHFEAEAFDELSFAKIAASHFGSPHNARTITPSETAALLPKIAEAYDEPFGNSSAVPAYYCAEAARDQGVSIMLAGDGGDELFAGNERYVLHQKLAIYGALPSPVRALVDGLMSTIPYNSGLDLLRKARGYVEKAKVPMPEQLEVYNPLQAGRLATIFEPDFLAAVDPEGPLETLRSLYAGCDSPSLLRRIMHLDLQLTLADNDLRKVTRMCEMAGVQVRFPFLDEALVDFAAQIPPELLIRRWRLRYFYKKAMRGFLPKETIEKNKHGFALPFRVWMENANLLRDLVGDTLIDLKGRRIVKSSYLDAIIDHWDPEEAKMYAPIIWGLTVLELWLQRRNL